MIDQTRTQNGRSSMLLCEHKPLNNSDDCARRRKKSRAEFDRVLRDVVVLMLPQAAKREVGGRRTETE